MTEVARRLLRHAACVGTVAATFAFGLGQPTAQADPQRTVGLMNLCPAQRTALSQVNMEILAHNAKPNVFTPQQRAQYNAYNAEAAELDARGTAALNALNACLDAAKKLISDQKFNPAPRGLTQLIKRARGGAPNRQKEIEKLVDFLSEQAQDFDGEWQRLQQQDKPEVGDADPARPGQYIGSGSGGEAQVTPEMLVPLGDIVQMPRALELDADSLWMVAMSPLNREWVSNQGALALRSDSVAVVSGMSDEWREARLDLIEKRRGELEELIRELADSQPPTGR